MAGSIMIGGDVFEQVKEDGIPRQATGVDGDGIESLHMVFRDSRGGVRSCLMENWPRERDEVEAGIAARRSQRDNLAARVNLLTGKRVGELRSQEVLDLMEAVFTQLKMLDGQGKLRPYEEWGRPA